MDVKDIAKKLVPLLGGKENVTSAQHCATRLRLVIRDESKIDQKGLDEIDDIKGAFSNSGQFQIIFGTGLVNKVHAEFMKELGVENQTTEQPANHQEEMKKKDESFRKVCSYAFKYFCSDYPCHCCKWFTNGATWNDESI